MIKCILFQYGKLLSGIKSTYVRVKWGESEWFRIDNGIREGCIMFPWLFNVYMDAMMKEVKMGMGRRGESRDYLTSCIQMNWFCVMSRKKT